MSTAYLAAPIGRLSKITCNLAWALDRISRFKLRSYRLVDTEPGLLRLFARSRSIWVEARFGPAQPGQRCGAKTRRGTACQRSANKKNGRCRLHGRASTGAKTEEGRAWITAANPCHGKSTKDKVKKTSRERGQGTGDL